MDDVLEFIVTSLIHINATIYENIASLKHIDVMHPFTGQFKMHKHLLTTIYGRFANFNFTISIVELLEYMPCSSNPGLHPAKFHISLKIPNQLPTDYITQGLEITPYDKHKMTELFFQ